MTHLTSEGRRGIISKIWQGAWELTTKCAWELDSCQVRNQTSKIPQKILHVYGEDISSQCQCQVYFRNNLKSKRQLSTYFFYFFEGKTIKPTFCYEGDHKTRLLRCSSGDDRKNNKRWCSLYAAVWWGPIKVTTRPWRCLGSGLGWKRCWLYRTWISYVLDHLQFVLNGRTLLFKQKANFSLKGRARWRCRTDEGNEG